MVAWWHRSAAAGGRRWRPSQARTHFRRTSSWLGTRADGVVARLKRDGVGIEADWLWRIGPAHFSQINFRGTFRFNVERYADVLVERAAGKGAAKSGQ